jgi:two-component system invasion response regulator UvrY
MINVLIADDHSVVRAGLRQIISGVDDLVVADEVGSADEALDKIRKKSYSVVVLDIEMPGRSGLDVLKEIKCEFPGLPVLMLTMHREDYFAVKALRSGAAGYMTKDTAPEELLAAVRTVAAGRKYISQSLAERLSCNLDAETKKEAHEALSEREYEVLCLIAAGKTVSQIADQLTLSVKTVSTYRVRTLEKMRLRSNAELTNYAIKNGLIA